MRKSILFVIGLLVLVAACNPDYKKAMDYKKNGDWAKAQEYMLKAVEANPKDATYHNELGFIYQKRRYYELAQKEYNQAANLDPYYVEAHYNNGTVLFQLRRYQQSRQAFETVLKLDPNNAKALNNLGLINQLFNKDDKAALELYQKAISLEPSNPTYFENLCKLYQDMGDDVKSKEACKRASALKSTSAK